MRSPHRFFIPGVSSAERIEAPRDEAQHIVRVLRLKIGDTLAAFDGTGVECACRIAEQSGRRVLLDVMERRAVSRELPVRVTLAIAASKNKAMDLIVQKCTELGLARLIPFHSGRSVARVDDGDKAEKWRRVAVEAAKQCGRNVLPQIDPPLALEGMIAGAREHDVALVAAPGPQAIPLKQALYARPQARGIIYSSLLFAALHQSLVAFLPIFFLAMVLAYLYEKTGSLWPSIILHMANNTVATLFAILVRRAI